MKAIEEAALFYAKHKLPLSQDLEWHLKWGYVFVRPDRLMLAREILVEKGPGHFVESGQGDCYFIHFAVGRGALRWFLDQAPRPLPFLAWLRFKDRLAGNVRGLHVVSAARFSGLV